ncbi:Na+/H+ antiporter subunit E [Kamptonema cortianum]|nr:Na+/H+ antiporter subunit E [Geitlerinema splendidum]MDK3158491.1 Na+/H+ antiporter subunit E [Kamptonema cortianum]
MLLWNVMLALVWCWLQGSFTAANILGGFTLGYILLWLLAHRGIVESKSYIRQLPQFLSLAAFFLWELIVANFRLALDLLTPGISMKPAIIAMPLDAETDAEITLVASLITLTPGTLSMDVSEDRKTLYVHAMYADNEEELVQSLKNGFERRVLEVLR